MHGLYAFRLLIIYLHEHYTGSVRLIAFGVDELFSLGTNPWDTKPPEKLYMHRHEIMRETIVLQRMSF